jgi:hypothetical protein
MYEPVVFGIRISGRLSESWSEYFGAQSISIEEDETGLCTTLLISEPVDQAALVGMINYLNSLGLPLVSLEYLVSPAENEPSEKGHA